MPPHNNPSIFSAALNLFTTGDKILVVMLIIFGSVFFFGIDYHRQPGETCSIEVDGKLTHFLKLSDNQDVLISGANGEILIRIKETKVRVLHSKCPEKICVYTGWIRNRGEFIVCVPNKVVVKINGAKEDHFNVITQ